MFELAAWIGRKPAARSISTASAGTVFATLRAVSAISESGASVVLALSLLALGAGCESNEGSCRVERVVTAIVQGHPRTDYLGLGELETRAILALELLRIGEVRDLCSGTALTSELVLTAAHCVDESVVEVTIAGHTWPRWGDDELVIRIVPGRDVAVIRLPGLAIPATVATSTEDAARFRGALVELAGAGRRQDGAAGSVELAVAEVLSVDERYLAVRLPQGGGPCAGDSGGPLLVRGPSGRLEIAGVLSQGAPRCDGPDFYERLDGLEEWLAELPLEVPASSDDCGSMTEAGRCFGARAVWCEGGRLQAEDCWETEACGYSLEANAFRCVESAADPCGGVPDTGRCVNSDAVRCVDGHLERLDCGACGGECTTSAQNGRAVCALLNGARP